MISKLYSLKKYLSNFGLLSEAFDLEALIKFAKLTQGENTSLFEQAFPDEDPEERKGFADRFYEIFKFLKDDQMFRGIISSASSFDEIKAKIEECEEAVLAVQNIVAQLGLPPNAANQQAKQYLYKFYEELGDPAYFNRLDGVKSRKDFFALLKIEKRKADESKLEKYNLSAEKAKGLSPKEVEWIIKILDIAEAGGEAHSADDAISIVKIFHKERDKFDKKIWEFDSYSAAQSYLDSKSGISEAAYMASIKDAAQSNEMSKVIYEDDRWKVVLIGSTIAGQYWRHATGADSGMCIGTLSNNKFAYYSIEEGVDPYFIIDKKNSYGSNPMRMFTISTERDLYEGWPAKIQGQDNIDDQDVSTMTNANNVGINISKIKEALSSDYNKIISAILDDANSREQTLGKQNTDKARKLISNKETALNNLEKVISFIPEYIALEKDNNLLRLNIPEVTRKIAEIYATSYHGSFIDTFYHVDGFEDLKERFWDKENLDLSGSQITKLPDGLRVRGNLNLSHGQITQLPEGLRVGGYLNLHRTSITRLPDGLRVGGALSLRETKITQLPEDLEVGGNLDLSHSQITQLPEGLRVGGDLNLPGTPITRLPDRLRVGGGLNFSYTKITQLPEDLEVGGNLMLHYTKITQLPEDLEVRGDLNLSGTPITRLPDGLRVGGGLNFWGTKITQLPDGLRVGGDLKLYNGGSGPPITRLPDDLTVGGDLDLYGTQITKLPDDLSVGGALNLYGTQITDLPVGLEVEGDLDVRMSPLASWSYESIRKIVSIGGKIKR